jgi:DNA-binding NarL/FixJ family response regulator
MPGPPVRLAIASRDHTVEQGLRRMLAEQAHRVVVVDHESGGADVVLLDFDVPEAEAAAVLRHTGAVGWVPLRVGVEQIVALVETAAGGPRPGLVEELGLSPREVQMLVLIAAGLTNKEIADQVYVSINSVKTYIRAAYRKIGVTSRSQAAVWWHQHGTSDG